MAKRKGEIAPSQRANHTLASAMEWVGIGPDRAKTLIENREWRAFRIGREIRIITASILEWQERESGNWKGA